MAADHASDALLLWFLGNRLTRAVAERIVRLKRDLERQERLREEERAYERIRIDYLNYDVTYDGSY